MVADPSQEIIKSDLLTFQRRKNPQVSQLTIQIKPETSLSRNGCFGFTLSKAVQIPPIGMSESARRILFDELFGKEGNQITISYLTVGGAAFDLNERPFSYNDWEDSLAIDLELEKFDLGPRFETI